MLAEENAAVSVLNLYKRAIEERYENVWLPPNHRKDFLVVLRRLRDYNKNKPKKSKGVVMGKKDAATSPIGNQADSITPANTNATATTSCATESIDQNAVAISSDMGTSPMHTDVVQDPQNISLATADDDLVVSIANLSVSTPESDKCLANGKVNDILK